MARLDNLDYEVNGVTTNYEIVPEIAPLFNTTTAYAAGDQVIHECIRYRFTTAHPVGAWIGTDVEEMPTVAEELTSHGADITELKADFTQLDGKIAASLITNTASGAIASFEDGADGVPVKDLVVDIEPVQDLHGYDAPWPAGGGKNLFGGEYNVKWLLPTPLSIHNGDMLTVSTSVPASGNPRINIYTGEGGATRWYNAGINDTVNNRKVKVMTFTEDVTITAFMVDVAECTNIQIEYGSTATDYAPYSNICPISGWTGANVSRTGKNLFDGTHINGYISDDGTEGTDSTNYHSDFIRVANGQNYVYSLTSNYANNVNRRVHAYDANKNWVQMISKNATNGTGKKAFPFAVPSGIAYIRVQFIGNGQTDISDTDIQIEPGSVASDFTPYTGTTLPISWQSVAGTVYGGTLDVTSGVLTVDRAGVTLDGTEDWSMYADGKFFVGNVTNNARKYSLSEQPLNITNKYLVAGNGDSQSSTITTDKRVYGQLSYRRIWVYDSDFETLESFTASLAETPLQVVYLITPQTYQLTLQEVSTLLGLNNIWADCGDVSVDYRADTKLYIENLTAPSEDDMIANTNIPDATYFMVGNTLYLSTTTIPAGDTINPGTNCTLMNLAAALNAINA